MKRFLIVALILTLCIVYVPAQAQESCDIDLLDAISRLAEAQRAANDGDTAAATQIITEVNEQLATLLQSCAQSNAALPATFEFPDGLFRFNHPEGWAKLSPIAGVQILGNNQAAMNSIFENNFGKAVPAGTQLVVTAYRDMKSLFNANSFADLVEQMQDRGMSDRVGLISPEDVTINDYPGVKFTLSSDLFDGAAYILDLRADHKIAFFMGLTPRDEFDAFAPTFEAIVASIQVGRRQATSEATTPTPAVLNPNEGKPLSEITYGQVVSISDLIDEVDPRTAMLAPDGTRIAWFDRRDDGGICVYELAAESTQCQTLPETFASAAPYVLWSPDSRYVAFTQDGLRYFHEPDIWVFDTENQVFSNRTDDGINRWRLLRPPQAGDSPGPLWFDHTFTWGPDGNIYFMRFNAPDAAEFGEGTSGLYRISPSDGEAELIRDLTNNFVRLSIYQQQEYNLNGAMAVSPDASQIAFIVMENDFNSTANGVWLMPLSGDKAPHQVVRAIHLKGGTTEVFRNTEAFLIPMGLAWTPDQTGLYMLAHNPQYTTDATTILYHVNVKTGTVTPLTDFSGYTRDELFSVDETTGHTPFYNVPRAAVMSPDGTTPLVFHREVSGGEAGLTALTFSEDGVESTTLFEFDHKMLPALNASAASDGKLLIFGSLLLPEE